MENRKTLYELGVDYEKDVKTLTAQIKFWREKLRNDCTADRAAVGRRLSALYEMRRDAKITADTLKYYYDARTEKCVYHRTNIF